MNYCSHCGAEVEQRIPEGDNRLRYVCPRCGAIHYQNPKIVVGCIPEWEDCILLCQRAIEPRYGLWTLPAGFMEQGETAHEGAARETLEEAGARVEVTGLYSMFSLPHIDQVYLLYRSRMLDLDFAPGEESLKAELFRLEDIPWNELAFAVVRETLRLYVQDRASGYYPHRSGTILRQAGDPRRYEISWLNQSVD